MPNDFQKTVNLKDKADKERQRLLYGEPEKKAKSKAEEIDDVYKQSTNKSAEDNLRKINRPPLAKRIDGRYIKRPVILLALIIMATISYFLFFGNKEQKQPSQDSSSMNWYEVELANKDIYYGQINDLKTDPVLIKNAYIKYNKGEEGCRPGIKTCLARKTEKTGEPPSDISIVRTQIISMKPLGKDSEILKEILKDLKSFNK